MSVDPDGGPEDRLTPVLRPVRAGNGFEEALEQILQVVRLGLVPGGERLPAERELAERLGISRVTLREVLKVLQDQGLVEARRGRYGGTFVLPRTDAGGEDELRRRIAEVDIEDVLRFREVLEVGAAGLCAAHGLTDEQAGRLREALARTHEAPLAEYRRLDTLLHLTLSELCGSPPSPPSTRPYAPPSTSSSTAFRSSCAIWSTPSGSTSPSSRPSSTGTRTGRARSCGSTARERRRCCGGS